MLTPILTIGSVTTIFTLAYSVLLRPLPYPDDERLVIVGSVQPGGFRDTFVEYDDFEVFRAETRSFEAWALYPRGYIETTLDSSSEPLLIQDMLVTPELFRIREIPCCLRRP